jgi:hypothetical protein
MGQVILLVFALHNNLKFYYLRGVGAPIHSSIDNKNYGGDIVMQEWKEAIWIAVSAMLAALVITFASSLGAIGGQIADQQQTQYNNMIAMQEYRQWDQYDNTLVYPQDVISFILQYRGDPEAFVDTSAGGGAPANYSLQWTSTSAPCAYTDQDISDLLPIGVSYTANIIKDGNGAVIAVQFRRN